MAFPAIQAADTKNGTVTSNSASWTLTYPTNLASGDLILGFFATDGNVGGTWPAGFVNIDLLGNAGAVSGGVAKKVSDGTETGTFTLSLSGAEQGGWRLFRITGWEGTIGTNFATGAVQNRNVSNPTGSSNVPNPPSCSPTWGAADTLWFAACVVDTSRTISVYPLADNNTADVSGGAGGATLGLCTSNNAAATLDPGTFTISSADDWGAETIAVRPGAGGAVTYTKAGFGKENA